VILLRSALDSDSINITGVYCIVLPIFTFVNCGLVWILHLFRNHNPLSFILCNDSLFLHHHCRFDSFVHSSSAHKSATYMFNKSVRRLEQNRTEWNRITFAFDRIESNRIESNQIKSNRIESNQWDYTTRNPCRTKEAKPMGEIKIACGIHKTTPRAVETTPEKVPGILLRTVFTRPMAANNGPYQASKNI